MITEPQKVDLWHPRLTRTLRGQTDAEFAWNKQTWLQHSRPWCCSALPLSQCTLFPGWVQEQHMQDFHNRSSTHNPNLPEIRQMHESAELLGKRFSAALFQFHSLVWQETDSRFSHNVRVYLHTFGFAHNPKSISFKLWSSSINKFSCRAEKSPKNEWGRHSTTHMCVTFNQAFYSVDGCVYRFEVPVRISVAVHVGHRWHDLPEKHPGLAFR